MTRVPHQALAEAIVARARAGPQNGSLELRFALEPDDLGPVRVRIRSRGDGVKIRIIAWSSAAVDTLGSGVARLHAQMQDAGFRDAQIDLGLDDTTHARGEHERHDANGETSRDRRGHDVTADSPHAPDTTQIDSQRSSNRQGRLDRTA